MIAHRLGSAPHRAVFAAGLMLLAVLPAHAASFCDDLRALAGTDGEGAELYLPVHPATDKATCGTSLSLAGARDLNCHWVFPYRSETATEAFEAVIAEMSACLGAGVVQSTDQRVNHPDAYDLRLFEVDGQEFAVSLKDKGALQQTLVFVRIPLTATP